MQKVVVSVGAKDLLDPQLMTLAQGSLGDVRKNNSTYLGGNSIEKNVGLSFGLKNGLRFHFDSKTCLNYPFSNIFFSVGNLEPKLK